MKKTLATLLALVMLLALLPLCAVVAEAPVVVTWLMSGDNTPTPDNLVLQEIEKQIGVRMEVTYVPSADYTAKLNTMIASRTLPDIFTCNDVATAIEFRDNGLLLPLDDLLKEYGQTILTELGDDLAIAPINGDGTTYGVISASLPYASNFAVRTDWLEKLGLSMPTDLDSLYEVLKAFTFDDPDQNGAADTIGYVASMASDRMRMFEHIFGAFGIAVDRPYLMEDGTVTTYMKAPGYLDAIKYLRKLYQDGLLLPDFATIPQMSAFELLWTGRTGVFDFQDVGTTNNWMKGGRYTENPQPTFDFTVIAGPDGKSGPARMYPRYEVAYVISSACKNPEAAMKLLDFVYSEAGDELLYLGVEGTMFEWVDKANGQYQLLGDNADQATHRANGAFVYWRQLPFNNAEARTMNKQTRDGQAYAREQAVDYPLILTPLQADIEYKATLRDLNQQAFAELIMSKGDVEAEYQAFVERWNNEGGLDYEAEATAAYAAEQAK